MIYTLHEKVICSSYAFKLSFLLVLERAINALLHVTLMGFDFYPKLIVVVEIIGGDIAEVAISDDATNGFFGNTFC